MAVPVIVIVVVVVSLVIAAAATAVAAAATALFEILRLGHATEFDGLGDVIVDAVAQTVELFLGFDETLRHGIGEERVAAALKIRNLLAAER